VFSSLRDSMNRGGHSWLWRIAAEPGSRPRIVLGVGQDAWDVSVAPRGHRLAYVEARTDEQLWHIKRPTNPNQPSVPTRFCPSTHDDLGPRYSRDGKRVAFVSHRSGAPEIWVCDDDGQNPRQLTGFRGPWTGYPSWSADNRRVAFNACPQGRFAIFVANVEGGQQPRQLSSGENDWGASWSRDNTWIYFTSRRSGSPQIWKARDPEGEEVRLTTTHGGVMPCEATDGTFVYYFVFPEEPGNAPAIWKVSVDGGKEERVREMPKGLKPADWALADNGIYFLDSDATPHPTIQFFEFASQRTSVIAQLSIPSNARVRGCSVSPDGTAVLYGQSSSQKDIMLVEGFR
jgi:dipeptidyl aminopeptidase/acylaminoacyl peptidase